MSSEYSSYFQYFLGDESDPFGTFHCEENEYSVADADPYSDQLPTTQTKSSEVVENLHHQELNIIRPDDHLQDRHLFSSTDSITNIESTSKIPLQQIPGWAHLQLEACRQNETKPDQSEWVFFFLAWS